MHDIDSKINRITETDNYMEQLQQITGNIFSIDREYFKDLLKKVDVLEKLIVPTLIQYFETDNIEIVQKYSKISSEFNVVESSISTITKKKSSKSLKKSSKEKKEKIVEIINHKCIGKELMQSDWFNLIKELEQKSNDLLESFDTSSYEKVKEIYDNDKTLLTIKTFYEVPITSSQKLTSLKNLNKITNQIIDLYTQPLYDVKKKIKSNWSKLNNIFKDVGETEDIIKMLEQFIICKYRCEITGNNKYYMKLFQNLFTGDNSIDKMDGSKFLRIVDSIDTEQLKKGSNISKFSDAIKLAIHSMGNNEQTLEQALEQIRNIMDPDENEKKANEEEKNKVDNMEDPLAEEV